MRMQVMSRQPPPDHLRPRQPGEHCLSTMTRVIVHEWAAD